MTNQAIVASLLALAAYAARKKGEETPKRSTRKAMAELEAGNGKKLASVEALMADLNADD